MKTLKAMAMKAQKAVKALKAIKAMKAMKVMKALSDVALQGLNKHKQIISNSAKNRKLMQQTWEWWGILGQMVRWWGIWGQMVLFKRTRWNILKPRNVL